MRNEGTIMYRYAAYKNYDLTAEGELSGYGDADSVSKFVREAMVWANGTGLIRGVTDTVLAPKDFASRAQVAAIFHRFCESIAE